MIKARLHISPDVADLFEGFSDEEIEEILLEAAEGYAGPVMTKHWEDGQGKWGDPGEDYLEWKAGRYGSSQKFVKSGEALKAIKTGTGPHVVKKVFRQGGAHRIEVALVRIEGDRNIYSIAQAGGKNNAGPPMRISDNLPGDAAIIKPHVIASVNHALKRKGLL